jgi:hypothetical protein
MHAAVVVPAEEFREYMPKMPLIPDQHSVEMLPIVRKRIFLNNGRFRVFLSAQPIEQKDKTG